MELELCNVAGNISEELEEINKLKTVINWMHLTASHRIVRACLLGKSTLDTALNNFDSLNVFDDERLSDLREALMAFACS